MLLLCRILCWLYPSTLTCIEEDCHAVDLEHCWTALPLSATCAQREEECQKTLGINRARLPDNSMFNLVFFSTVQDIALPIKGPMEDTGVVRFMNHPQPSVSTS